MRTPCHVLSLVSHLCVRCVVLTSCAYLTWSNMLAHASYQWTIFRHTSNLKWVLRDSSLAISILTKSLRNFRKIPVSIMLSASYKKVNLFFFYFILLTKTRTWKSTNYEIFQQVISQVQILPIHPRRITHIRRSSKPCLHTLFENLP